MLFVISLPDEYGIQVKEKARVSGKKVQEIFYDMISSQFEKQTSSQSQDELKNLNLLLTSLENEKNYRTSITWSREELYER